MTKLYYAIAHDFGSLVHHQGAPNGDRGQIYVFDSRSERNEWVKAGPGWSQPGERENYTERKVRAHVQKLKAYGHLFSTAELVKEGLRQGVIMPSVDAE